MIKTDEQDFIKNINTILPSHWRIQHEEVQTKHPTTTRIIAIGGRDDRFRTLLINAIKEAQQTIMLCSFILSDERIIEELLNAAKRHVRCYLMFSTEAQLAKEYREDMTEFDQQTLEVHKNMLDRLVGKALARTNEHLHAKFLLIDYGTPHQKGFISTANFTYEALTRNQEIGIILTNEEIEEVFDFFRFGFWTESNQELVRLRSWDSVKQEKINPITQKVHIKETTSQVQDIKAEVLDTINKARIQLLVASYGFDEDHEVVNALVQKARTNEITILTRPREKNIPTIEKLFEAGATILGYDFLHAKFVLAPRDLLGIIMTANMERRGLDSGYEIGKLLNDKDNKELQEIIAEWIKHAPLTWEKGGDVQNQRVGKIKVPNGRELIEREIIPEYNLEPEEKTPKALIQMQRMMTEEPTFPTQLVEKVPKVIRLKRIIHPPKLPENAVRVEAKDYWKTQIHDEKEIKGKSFLSQCIG
jgi:cardiolipin synthase